MVKAPKNPSLTIRINFGRRLRGARKDAGYNSYAEFAAAVDLEAETYRLYETGQREPAFHVLAAISKKLDVSLDYLILGKGHLPRPAESDQPSMPPA